MFLLSWPDADSNIGHWTATDADSNVGQQLRLLLLLLFCCTNHTYKMHETLSEEEEEEKNHVNKSLMQHFNAQLFEKASSRNITKFFGF